MFQVAMLLLTTEVLIRLLIRFLIRHGKAIIGIRTSSLSP